jgi:DNA-binding NarL/FixJ family response regulator
MASLWFHLYVHQEVKMIRVLLADRDFFIKEGIRSVLSRKVRDVLIEEASTSKELMDSLMTNEFDVVVVELALSASPDDEIVKQICRVAPRSRVLVFTILDELPHGVQAMRCGAKGYLTKTCSVDEFLLAFNRISAGNLYVREPLAGIFASYRWREQEWSPYDRLTNRELEIYSMLVCGKRVVEIADMLDLSQKTISTHKARIMSKFRFKALSDMVNYAVSHGHMNECHARVNRFSDASLRMARRSISPTAGCYTGSKIGGI